MYQLAARFLSVSLVWAAFGCIAQQLAWICTFRETEEDWWTSFYALCRLNFYNQAHNKGRWLISSTRSSPGRPLIQAAWESPHSSHPCYKQCYFSPPHLIQPTKRTKPSYQRACFLAPGLMQTVFTMCLFKQQQQCSVHEYIPLRRVSLPFQMKHWKNALIVTNWKPPRKYESYQDLLTWIPVYQTIKTNINLWSYLASLNFD